MTGTFQKAQHSIGKHEKSNFVFFEKYGKNLSNCSQPKNNQVSQFSSFFMS